MHPGGCPEKICKKCGETKPLRKFRQYRRNGEAKRDGTCRGCRKARLFERMKTDAVLREKYYALERRLSQRKRAQKPEQYSRMKKAALMRRRLEVYEKYGGPQCAACGEADVIVLCLDHIWNNGADERRRLGKNIQKLFAKLKRENYPPGYQVLCANCNHAKNINGGVIPKHRFKMQTKSFEAAGGI